MAHTPRKTLSSRAMFQEDGFKPNIPNIPLAKETLAQKYPNYGKDGHFWTFEVSKRYSGNVAVFGPRGGETPLFTNDN